jgi:hypothetical protein
LPGQLTSFTESIAKTGSNLEELKTQHSAAVKALEAQNKKKPDDKKKVNASKTASTPPNLNPAAEFKDGKPVFGSKGTPPTGESRSLFDTANRLGRRLRATCRRRRDNGATATSERIRKFLSRLKGGGGGEKKKKKNKKICLCVVLTILQNNNTTNCRLTE